MQKGKFNLIHCLCPELTKQLIQGCWNLEGKTQREGGKRQIFEANPTILKQFWQYLSKNRGAVAPPCPPSSNSPVINLELDKLQ